MTLTKTLTKLAFHRGGGLHLVRYVNRKAVRILLYHAFPSEAASSWERQCHYLRRYYHPISLTAAVNALKAQEPLPHNTVVVSVDDGYRNFHTVAYPSLKRYGIPAIVFLVSDFLDRKSWLWVDQVKYLFTHAAVRKVEVPFANGQAWQFDLETASQRAEAAFLTKEQAKQLIARERMRLLAELPRLLNADLPEHPPVECSPMTWGQVREMSRNGIEFGGHTKTHPILSRCNDEAHLKDEIIGSKKRIEEELGMPLRHFSYPNGRWNDIDSRVVTQVKQAGFDAAVVAEGGLNFTSTDPFLLRRITAVPDQASDSFERTAAGLL